MNRQQFILLLVLAALAGAAGLFVHQRNHLSWESADTAEGGKLLPGLAVNEVAQIHIQSGTNSLLLARRDNLWRVNERGNYPANFSQISDFLLKCADLKMIQREAVGPSQLGRFDLLPADAPANAGTEVEFKDQSGQTLASLLLGKKHLKQGAANAGAPGMDGSWPDGRYVMSGALAGSVALISDPLDSVQTAPDQWLNKDFLTLEKPSAISVQYAVTTNSWKLTRASETNDWRLADARPDEKLDATKISTVTSPLSSPYFNDVAPLGLKTPAEAGSNTVLTVDTFDGLTCVAHIGPAHADTYPVTFTFTNRANPAAAATNQLAGFKQYENWVYYLPTYSLDEILKTRSQLLLQETNTVATPAAPASP